MTFCNQQPIQDRDTAGPWSVPRLVTPHTVPKLIKMLPTCSKVEGGLSSVARIYRFHHDAVYGGDAAKWIVSVSQHRETFPIRSGQLTTLSVVLHGINSPHL